MSSPYAATMTVSAPRSSPGSGRVGCSTGMPRRSRTSAPKGAVAATASFTSANDEPWAQRSERFTAGFGRRAVQDQRSVEVVELVLHDARDDSFEVVADLVAPLVT